MVRLGSAAVTLVTLQLLIAQGLSTTTYSDALRTQVDVFQHAMVTRNASLGVSLFEPNASWDIPFGSPSGHIVGHEAMLKDWSTFFGSLSDLKERVIGGSLARLCAK